MSLSHQMKEIDHLLSADHAFEWASTRTTPGWDAAARESTERAISAICRWNKESGGSTLPALQEVEGCNGEILLADLSDRWSVAIKQLESTSVVSRGLLGSLSGPELLKVADSAITEGKKHATMQAASLLVQITAVTIPELARVHSGTVSKYARLTSLAADVDREAGTMERQAAEQAAQLGLDLTECQSIMSSSCTTSELRCIPTPGALCVADTIASQPVVDAVTFAKARADVVQAKLRPDTPTILDTPAFDSLVTLDAPALAVQLSQEGEVFLPVLAELRAVLTLLLSAEQDTLALEKDRKAADQDGGIPINTLASCASSLVSAATPETVACHRAAIAGSLIQLTATPMRTALQRSAALTSSTVDASEAPWAGDIMEWIRAASEASAKAADLFTQAKVLESHTITVEECLGKAIVRGQLAKAAAERLIGSAIDRRVVITGCDMILGL